MEHVSTAQIAEYLNLSRNTVSKALNNNPKVNEKTRQLVISTAAKMGYKRMDIHDLRETTTPINNDICLLVHENEMHGNYWSMVLKGVEEYLTSKKYRIILGIVDKNSEHDGALPMVLNGNSPAGIIMIGVFGEQYYRMISSLGIPLVTVDTAANISDSDLICDTVLMACESSIYDITCDLIRRGYRDIAFAGNVNFCRSIYERWNGYRLAMMDNGLTVPDKHNAFKSLNFLAEYEDIAEFINKLDAIPQAIVCANDTIAYRIMMALRKKGLKIPEDVAVSGFDDYVPEMYTESELTSVAFDFKEFGNMAARQIVYRIDNTEANYMSVRLKSFVVYRRSTDNNITNATSIT